MVVLEATIGITHPLGVPSEAHLTQTCLRVRQSRESSILNHLTNGLGFDSSLAVALKHGSDEGSVVDTGALATRGRLWRRLLPAASLR